MSKPDTKLLLDETREVLKEALTSYAGDDTHLAIYAATRARDWNALQAELARTEAPSDPKRVATITDAVDDHLATELRSYLTIDSHL